MIVEKTGYFCSFKATVDEGTWGALSKFAEQRGISVDEAVECLVRLFC